MKKKKKWKINFAYVENEKSLILLGWINKYCINMRNSAKRSVVLYPSLSTSKSAVRCLFYGKFSGENFRNEKMCIYYMQNL